jgi:hypothetical protein
MRIFVSWKRRTDVPAITLLLFWDKRPDGESVEEEFPAWVSNVGKGNPYA